MVIYVNLQAVDLTKLNLMQLTQFKNGLDSDLQFYQESLQNLKMAQSKWVTVHRLTYE